MILRCSWFCCYFFVMQCLAITDFGSDTIYQGQELSDWEYLRSANGSFRLQFFNLGISEGRYLGIFPFLSRENQPVWVANWNNPIDDPSGTLMINGTHGMLNIIHSRGTISFPTTSRAGYRNINTSATLREDGNLVLRQVYPNGSISGTILWQSFDYPTDTLLPGMKLGINLASGHQWSLTSWISNQSFSVGSFTLGVDRNSTNQLIILWHGKVFWTSRLLQNGTLENSTPYVDSPIHFKYISNQNEKYFTYSQTTDGRYEVLRLTPDGKLIHFRSIYTDKDGRYEELGVTSDGKTISLSEDYEVVRCDLSPKVPQYGCIDFSLPECMKGDNNSFYLSTVNASSFWKFSLWPFGNDLSVFDCQAKCAQHCSCYGFASLAKSGWACAYWDKGNVSSMRRNGSGENLIYIRGNYTDKDVYASTKWRKRWWVWFISAVSGTSLLLLSIFCIVRNHKVKAKWKEHHEKKISQVHQYKFKTIEMATNKFSTENKIGEGGFGPVYKGKLLDSQEIAVKRLSKSSNQGAVEFKNEIQLIAKLQHNNLVRLLGCCTHGEEMMLVYEYMPNKSLDAFLFDPTKRDLLKWKNRTNIIEGIAQALIYLHKHSRLTVIHRDLKASNILLDLNMTPKVSDFGMAKIFEMQDVEANTKRIVGTYGYMAPEYAINGVVSTKIDIFSFGVLVLEIVSGKKNRSSYHSERPLNLIGLAWELWIEGRALDLVDTSIDVSNHVNEVQRCINVGLLCVQDSATERPSMTDVLLMLKNEFLQLPTPKQPAFFIETNVIDERIEVSQENNCTNKLSTSILEAR